MSAATIGAMLREAVALHQAGRLDEAGAIYARVLAAQPGQVDALNLAGAIALQCGDPARAAELIGAAVARNPLFADAQANYGNALRLLGRHGEALTAYDAALKLRPDHVAALANRAEARRALGQFTGAAADTERALALAPDLTISHGLPAADRARICDWSRRAADVAQLRAGIAAGHAPPPLELIALADDPVLQRRAGELLAPPVQPVPAFAAPDGRIRLGYFGGNLRDNAVGFLIVEALELHDRSRFAVTVFAWGAESGGDGGAMRRRFIAAAEAFEEVSALDDGAVAALARARGIDIALDLDGYTRGARPGIFAARAAPVQAGYLGYPGTTGSAAIDYLVADAVIAPAGSEAGFSEALVHLPGSYQPNDRQRAIAPTVPTRRAAGLPDEGTVFACFCQPYKIDPALFAGWLDLLRAVPGSVLWLIGGLPEAAANLRAAAQRGGVAPARLVFAPPLPLAAHLARHALADLALDTRAYNGHTTTSDALWAGLPVVTCRGQSFAARVSASLLTSVGLPELIAGSRDDYLALAEALARDPARLAALRARLAAKRSSAPLFDTPAYVRGFEVALAEMHRRRCAGLAPGPITVAG